MKRDAVLAALGIESENSGIFAGEWLTGNGPALASIDPTTEEVIAEVHRRRSCWTTKLRSRLHRTPSRSGACCPLLSVATTCVSSATPCERTRSRSEPLSRWRRARSAPRARARSRR